MHLSSLCLLLVGVPLLQASENTGIKMTIRRVFLEIRVSRLSTCREIGSGWSSEIMSGSEKQMAHKNGYPAAARCHYAV